MFKKTKKDKNAPVPKPATPSSGAIDHRKSIFIGLVMIITAFGCVVGIFYFVASEHQTTLEETKVLQEKLLDLDAKQDAAREKIFELEQLAGRSIEVDKLLREADKLYGQEEKARREGHLWIDRQAGVFIITLGGINGLQVGQRLAVYNQDTKVGEVQVEKPLDVISYVTPVDQRMHEFSQDYYRVVKEE